MCEMEELVDLLLEAAGFKEDDPIVYGLCYRCEHRAKFLETGVRPRYECGEPEKSKYACYMYRPVVPMMLAPEEDDKRPIVGPAFLTCRSEAVKPADMQLIVSRHKDGFVMHWVPKE